MDTNSLTDPFEDPFLGDVKPESTAKEHQVENVKNRCPELTGKDLTATAKSEEKHQLKNNWKLWHFENNKERTWEDNLRVVSPFLTVEDFWSVYNHIKSASELRSGCSYFVFKDGIPPMWEDAGNRDGGRWIMKFNRSWRPSLDNHWLSVILCLIEEVFDDNGDDICGAVVNIRGKMDKISIWTADCKNKDRILNIGKKLKERLNLNSQLTMTYESHLDTATKSSSSENHMFQIQMCSTYS